MSQEFRGEIWARDENVEVRIDLEFQAVQQNQISRQVHLHRDVRELWSTPSV